MKNCNMILTEKYLTGEEILPSNQRHIMEEAKFAYSPSGKTFEKQTKAIEIQGKKQIKAIKNHGKLLVESDEPFKKDFNINRDSVPFEEQNKIFNELVEETFSEFMSLEKTIYPGNLIYKYKLTE